MKILMVSPPWIRVPPKGYGGIEWVVSLLADELVSRGHDVTLFATGDSETKAELKHVFKDGQTQHMGRTIIDCQQVSEAFRIADEYDLVHDHSGFLGVAFSHRLKVPLLHTLHGVFNEDTTKFYSRFKDTCYYNAISEYQRNCLPILNYVDTVYNAIDTHHYPYSEQKEDFLILVGRVSPLKGTHLAAQVARQLEMPLVLIGKVDPVDLEYYETMVKPLVDGKNVIFTGEVDEQEKRDYLKRAKCFVFPMQWAEPFGLVMVEAMACGTPVVVIRNGSSSEVVKDGKVGLVVDSVEQMAPAVEKAIKTIDPKVCRQYALDNFSPEMMAERYEINYQRILEAR